MDGVGDMAGMGVATAIADTATAIVVMDTVAVGTLADGLATAVGGPVMAVHGLATVERVPDTVAELGRAEATAADGQPVAAHTIAAAAVT
jgi:hypothetical protein